MADAGDGTPEAFEVRQERSVTVGAGQWAAVGLEQRGVAERQGVLVQRLLRGRLGGANGAIA